ncbi:MAG: acetyl-CoA carboxylase biotin carboxyl carrier protein [Elusimicrobia bacterium]|jgi:acetyl-CoA carboxylase biotin carboxyl carrier protein|nr:acetyl-CoA carboxylase biotin carboxyl carrier protein [Elusimicrobiota bacterium]
MKNRVNGEEAPPTLEELLAFAAESGLSEVIWEKEGRRLAFKRTLAPVVPAPTDLSLEKSAPLEPLVHPVKSPMVGTFFRAPKGRPPLVVEGDEVSPGQRLGMVEAMQVPKDVVADVKGRIVRVLVENAHSVEYGQPLFEIEKSEGA